MRAITFTVFDNDDGKPSTLQVKQTVRGGILLGEGNLVCPCCIDQRQMMLVVAAKEALGLDYLLLPKRWEESATLKERSFFPFNLFKFVDVPDFVWASEVHQVFRDAEIGQILHPLQG